MTPDSAARRIVNVLIAAFALAFVGILALAAYFDASIRVLHLFESIPFLASAALCLRGRKTGYALGVAASAFLLLCSAVLTTFVRNGFERVTMLLRTGHVDRPDVLLGAFAGTFTAGLLIFSLWGYLKLPNKSWRDLGLFAGQIGLVVCFFLTIFAVFAPQYLAMFKPLMGK